MKYGKLTVAQKKITTLFYEFLKGTLRMQQFTEHFEKLAEKLSVEKVMKKLDEHPEMWDEIQIRQLFPGSAHKDTKTIYLRWNQTATLEDAFHSIPTEDYSENINRFMPEIEQLFKEFLPSIGEAGVLGRVMIVKLPPGGKIAPHTDEGAYAEYYDRFHVCLKADEGNVFHVGDYSFSPKTGDCWWFNHKKLHWVENNSKSDRIHLIVDIAVSKFRKKRGIYIQRERFVDCYEDAMPLLQQHYETIAHYKDIPLEVNTQRYIDLENQNGLRVFTVRKNGELIGYTAFFVTNNPHYNSSKQALQDVIYIAPEHRRGSLGIKLIQHSENALRKEGVQVIAQHAKIAHPALGKILERNGYTAVDVLYTKRLDKE